MVFFIFFALFSLLYSVFLPVNNFPDSSVHLSTFDESFFPRLSNYLIQSHPSLDFNSFISLPLDTNLFYLDTFVLAYRLFQVFLVSLPSLLFFKFHELFSYITINALSDLPCLSLFILSPQFLYYSSSFSNELLFYSLSPIIVFLRPIYSFPLSLVLASISDRNFYCLFIFIFFYHLLGLPLFKSFVSSISHSLLVLLSTIRNLRFNLYPLFLILSFLVIVIFATLILFYSYSLFFSFVQPIIGENLSNYLGRTDDYDVRTKYPILLRLPLLLVSFCIPYIDYSSPWILSFIMYSFLFLTVLAYSSSHRFFRVNTLYIHFFLALLLTSAFVTALLPGFTNIKYYIFILPIIYSFLMYRFHPHIRYSLLFVFAFTLLFISY